MRYLVKVIGAQNRMIVSRSREKGIGSDHLMGAEL